MFKSIIINQSNFGEHEVSLSTIRYAQDSKGEKFFYYWVTFYGPRGERLTACTGSSFTELLGEMADVDDATRDEKLATVLLSNWGRFEVAQAMEESDDLDENGKPIMLPIYIKDNEDMPLLKIQKSAHRVSLCR